MTIRTMKDFENREEEGTYIDLDEYWGKMEEHYKKLLRISSRIYFVFGIILGLLVGGLIVHFFLH